MSSDPLIERPFPFTTSARKRGRLTSSARGKTQRPKGSYRWFGLSTPPASQKITLTVTYRGGSEPVYLVQARGRHGTFLGTIAIHDIVSEIRQTGSR